MLMQVYSYLVLIYLLSIDKIVLNPKNIDECFISTTTAFRPSCSICASNIFVAVLAVLHCMGCLLDKYK